MPAKLASPLMSHKKKPKSYSPVLSGIESEHKEKIFTFHHFSKFPFLSQIQRDDLKIMIAAIYFDCILLLRSPDESFIPSNLRNPDMD